MTALYRQRYSVVGLHRWANSRRVGAGGLVLGAPEPLMLLITAIVPGVGGRSIRVWLSLPLHLPPPPTTAVRSSSHWRTPAHLSTWHLAPGTQAYTYCSSPRTAPDPNLATGRPRHQQDLPEPALRVAAPSTAGTRSRPGAKAERRKGPPHTQLAARCPPWLLAASRMRS